MTKEEVIDILLKQLNRVREDRLKRIPNLNGFGSHFLKEIALFNEEGACDFMQDILDEIDGEQIVRLTGESPFHYELFDKNAKVDV